jgi:NTE family protein
MTAAGGSPSAPATRAGVGLCLSGGGYRAMLFHAGSLWRLNELGWLPRLDFVSSVSGGSITAGVLAMAWPRLTFSGAGAGVATNFADLIAAPLRALARRRIDVPAVLTGVMTPRVTVNDRVVRALDKRLFDGLRLDELPDAPRFVFVATNLQTGSIMRLSKKYMRDYKVARVRAPRVPVARAVAASAAFPPVLSPAHIDVAPDDWDEVEPAPDGVNLWPPRRLLLSDGGVYDNLGLEPVYKRCITILVSDGGGHVEYAANVPTTWAGQLRRVLSVVDNQVRSLRKRSLIEDYQRGVFTGTYWGIRTNIADYGLPDQVLPAPITATRRLAATPTRLSRLPVAQIDRLINWGYAVTDAAMRKHMPTPDVPTAAFPCPGGVG